MKRAISSSLALFALLTLTVGFSVRSAEAAPFTLTSGSSHSETVSSTGADINQDFEFDLQGSGGLTVLANAQSETNDDFGTDLLTISLYDSGHNLIVSDSGTSLASFDSFFETGQALAAGSYLLNLMADVTNGKQAFVTLTLAANNVAATPIPAAGLFLLTGLGALGGLAARRRKTHAAA
jgi:hypothetical protein